jgi:hypothetical protein
LKPVIQLESTDLKKKKGRFLFESDPVKIMGCLRVYVATKVDKILPPCDISSKL